MFCPSPDLIWQVGTGCVVYGVVWKGGSLVVSRRMSVIRPVPADRATLSYLVCFMFPIVTRHGQLRGSGRCRGVCFSGKGGGGWRGWPPTKIARKNPPIHPFATSCPQPSELFETLVSAYNGVLCFRRHLALLLLLCVLVYDHSFRVVDPQASDTLHTDAPPVF